VNDLVSFLRARLDEEKEYYETLLESIQQYLPRQARALRDVDAKRRIVDEYEHWRDVAKRDDDPQSATFALGLHAALLRLALPDDQHQDYREEWKP
jgi:hypothetical protein